MLPCLPLRKCAALAQAENLSGDSRAGAQLPGHHSCEGGTGDQLRHQQKGGTRGHLAPQPPPPRTKQLLPDQPPKRGGAPRGRPAAGAAFQATGHPPRGSRRLLGSRKWDASPGLGPLSFAWLERRAGGRKSPARFRAGGRAAFGAARRCSRARRLQSGPPTAGYHAPRRSLSCLPRLLCGFRAGSARSGAPGGRPPPLRAGARADAPAGRPPPSTAPRALPF